MSGIKKIKTGDTVVITRGKDRGKMGAVLRVMPKNNRLVVEGLNLRTKHVRARRQGEKGQRVQVPGSLNVSNVKVVCGQCKRGVRVGFAVSPQGKKQRVCVSCGSVLST